MNFGYSKEQEKFRKELEEWFDANAPAGEELPAEIYELDDKTYPIAKKLREKLAEKGWLRPSYPKEYGGAALSYDELEVFIDVYSRRRIPEVYDCSYMVGPAILAFGTEEQKKRWLPLIGKGKIVAWECFTEPEAGTDLASVQTKAILQDDGDFLLNGGKIYSGDGHSADYLFTLAVTDPKAPRHHNLGMFLVKADSPGIFKEPLNPIAGVKKNVMHFDNVRVPAENLIGEVNKGWQVAQAALAGERGGTFFLYAYQVFDELLNYCKKADKNGKRLINDPHIQEVLTDLFIEEKAGRLMYWRTFWKGSHGIPTTYEGSQNNLYYKNFLARLGAAALEILGPSALITTQKWAVLGGRIERMIRYSLQTHGAGTPEAQKIIVSRFLGLPGARRKQS